MGNENKWEKGTFEKIDEHNYKINGNRITFLSEGDSDLIPIVRDIVEQKENVIIEEYNLSRSTYFINEKVIPVADLISEISNFLESLIIRRKNLENGICYYETKNRELSVEEELASIIEDIIYRIDRPLEEYKLPKKTYIINNKSVPVNDVKSKIYKLLFWHLLENWRVDEFHYNIKGEEFYLKDDDVQIIDELINDENESNWSKYEQKKCAYDINGNECFITHLGLYIIFLWDEQADDEKVRTEMKALCLEDGIKNDKMDFAKKVYCFIACLPPLVLRLFMKGEKEYHELSTARMKELTKDLDNHPRCEELSFAIIINGLLTFIENPLEQCFEGTSEELELLLQKFQSEKEEDFYDFLDEELDKQRLHFKDNKQTLNDVFEALSDVGHLSFGVLPEVYYYYLQAYMNVYREEYEQWKDNVKERGILNSDLIIDFFLDETLSMNFNFLFWYYYFEGHIFDQLFHAMNRSFIRPEVMKSIISKLQELGLSKYVQERYDKYRKLTGGGKDFCFCKLDVKEVAKELSRYYANLPSGRKNYSFTDYYLYDVVNDIIPNLKSGLDVAAFALLLWKSKLFDSSIIDEKFTSFRDDIARIFQLNTIPNISEYTAGKPKVKEKANNLMNQFECLGRLVEWKPLT